MESRFEQLMAGWREGVLTPAEQTELLALLRESEEHRRLAIQDRLIDRLLHESRQPALDAEIILKALPERPADLASATMAALAQRETLAGRLANSVAHLTRSLWRWLEGGLWRPLAFAGLVVALGLFSFLVFGPFGNSPIEIGKFTSVLGSPTLRHAGQGSTLYALRAAPVRLGDRIETGDADKCEIQFHDGTTLRLNFNTTLEIWKGESRNQKSMLLRPEQVKLLSGQVWAKVQKLTNPPPFAVQTPVAIASVKGTEFGLKLQRAPTNSALRTPHSALLARLTVSEGIVEFSNRLGSVQATAQTESLAQEGVAPTAPKRLAILKVWHVAKIRMADVNDKPSFARNMPSVVFPFGWLGFALEPPRDLTDGVPQPQAGSSVRISRVFPNSPAEAAGLQAGDLIEAVNGNSVTNDWQVGAEILAGPNRSLTLTLRRNDQSRVVTVVTVAPPKEPLVPEVPAAVEAQLYETTWHLIAEAHLHKTPSGETEAELERLARTYPNVAAVQNNFAFLKDTRDELGEALRCYQRAVELEPQVALYHFNRACALLSIGNFDRAIEELEQALVLAPTWYGARGCLAGAYSLVDRTEDALKVLEVGLQLDVQDADLWLEKARVLLRARQPDAALVAAQKAIELQPRDLSDAYYKLALAYLDLGRPTDAEQALREGLKINPDSPRLCVRLGDLLCNQGKLDEAEALHRRVLKADGLVGSAFNGLGRVFEARRQFVQAEKWYRKAAETDPEDNVYLNNLAQVCAELGRLDEAEALNRRALALDPEDVAGYSGLGRVFYLRGQHAEAEKWFRQAVEKAPDQPGWLINLAAELRAQGRLDEAEQYLIKATQLIPAEPEAFRNLATLYTEQGKLDQAEQAFRRRLGLQTKNAAAWRDLGVFLRDHQQLEEAENCLRRAIELAPDSPFAYGELGHVFYARGQIDEARKCYRKEAEKEPNDAESCAKHAHGCLAVGRLDEAEAILDRALELDPGNVTGLQGLGYLFEKRGQLEEAEKWDRKALERDANNPITLNNLAWRLAEQGIKLDEALKLARRAVELAPDQSARANNLDTLGWVHFKRGELEQAEEILKTALELAGQSPIAADIRAHLKKLQEKKGE